MGLPAGRRRPVRLWSGSCGLVRAWRGEGLAEASFLLRLLMAPSGHPNRIREASPELRIALLGEAAPGTCHQLGLSQPRVAFMPPLLPGPQTALEEFVPEGGLRHLGSGRLFAELAGGGPGFPREGGGAWSPAVGAVTSCTRKLWAGQLSRAGTPRQEPERTPGLSGEKYTAGSRNF